MRRKGLNEFLPGPRNSFSARDIFNFDPEPASCSMDPFFANLIEDLDPFKHQT